MCRLTLPDELDSLIVLQPILPAQGLSTEQVDEARLQLDAAYADKVRTVWCEETTRQFTFPQSASQAKAHGGSSSIYQVLAVA